MIRSKVCGGYILKIFFVMIILGMLLVIGARAVPVEEWSRTFGGDSYDYGNSVKQTSDGGYIVVGETNSYGAGQYDVYLIKVAASGSKLWEKIFGGSNNEKGNSVQQTTDGGYIIVGSTGSYGAGGSDVYLIKTDASGNELWNKTFGGGSSDGGYSVQQTTDGGYIIAGGTSSYGNGNDDVYLIKTDASGSKLWEKTFGGRDYDRGYSIQQTADGGYIIVGLTSYNSNYNTGSGDVYLIKTDASGSKLWEKTFGGRWYIDYGNSVQQTADGGYIIVGYTESYGAAASTNDIYLIKTDASGNKQWEKLLGGSSHDSGHSASRQQMAAIY